MGKRKRIAAQSTYHLIYVGRQRPPKGRRWTKPADIIKALDTLIVKATFAGEDTDPARIASLRTLREFASEFLNRINKNGRRTNKGNVYLEYAWDRFTKQGKILDEQDIRAAAISGDINRWYLSLTGGRQGVVKTERVWQTTNPGRLREQIQAAQSKSGDTTDRDKVVGDQIRAEALDAQRRRAEFAEQFKAEQALIAQLKANIKSA